MKNPLLSAAQKLSLALATASLACLTSAQAATTTWIGALGGSGNINWSTTADWSGVTPVNNAADFNIATTNLPGVVTVNVDGSYATPGAGNGNAWGLIFGQTNGYQTVLVQPGVQLQMVAANGTEGGGGLCVVPTTTNSGGSATGSVVGYGLTYTNYTTIEGTGGTLYVDGSVFVEAGSSNVLPHYSILDLSHLDNFIQTNTTPTATGDFYVAGDGVQRSQAIMYLARTNVISPNSAMQVGYLGGTYSNSQPIGLYLGQSNAIIPASTVTFSLGYVGCTNAFMQFNPFFLGGPTPPTAYIAARNGAPMNQVNLGFPNNGKVSGTTVCDFTGGNVTWIANTFQMGGSAATGINATAILTFDNGTITANNLTVGFQNTSAGGFGAGTINVNSNLTYLASGTLVCLNTLTLGKVTGTANTSTAGTINLNSGTLVASTITNAGGVGTVDMTNSAWSVALNSPSLTNMTVTAFNGGGTNVININFVTPLLGSGFPVRFHLIGVANPANLVGASTLGLGTLPTSYDPTHPYAGYLDTTTTPGLVDFVLTAGPTSARSLIWTGTNTSGPIGTWDIGTTADWQTGGVATTYNQFDLANFYDLASGSSSVNLTTTLTPYSLTVSNTATPYTLGGGGNLGGFMSLTKQGAGTLVIDNSASNSFSGGVTLSGGTLQIGNNDTSGNLPAAPIVDNATLVDDRNDTVTIGTVISGTGSVISAGGGTLQLAALNSFTNLAIASNNSTLQGGVTGAFGASTGTVLIQAGSTLDPNGVGTTRAVTVSGTGVGGEGAIVNSGGTIGDASGGLTPTLTLAGNTTLSYPSRWDLGSSTGATLSTGGHAYNLTLNGQGNYFEWRDVKSDTNLANIEVTSGDLGIAGSTTLGNPASTLTIDGYGAGIKFYNDDGFNAAINKQVYMNDLGLIQNGAGSNTMYGTLTLNNTGNQYCYFTIGGTSLTINSTLSGNAILWMQGSTAQLTYNGNGSAFTGGVLIPAGTFILNGSIGSGIIAQSSSILGGAGSATGAVEVQGGATFYPGGVNATGTFTASGGLTLDSGAAITMDLRSTTTVGAGTNDLVAVTGNLTVSGNTIMINPVAGTLAAGTYVLMTYTGTLNGTFAGAQMVSSSRYTLALNTSTPGQVQLVVSGNPNSLLWNNGSGNAAWDIQQSLNWSNLTTHAEDEFFTSDTVIFDDTISSDPNPATTINVTAAVSPSLVTNNSSANSYTITGTGKITGGAGIIKLGSSTLNLKTTNDFSGNVTVLGGTVKAGPSGLGNTLGTVYVTNGATLDIDYSLAGKPLVLGGVGVGGMGALVNNDPSATSIFSSAPGLLNVTMTGDTTLGGSNRIDFGQNGILGAVLNTGGNNYNLTILGSTYRQWDNVTLDANFGNITVGGGTLGLVGLTTLGNPANTLSVSNGDILVLYDDNSSLSNVTVNKKVLLYNGATMQNGGGSNVVSGLITLGVANGDNCNFNVGGTILLATNVISGPGSLIKTGASPLALSGANTYTGNTVITTGPLDLIGNGSIYDSADIILASGQVLDVSGRLDKTLDLELGQTLQGSGTINGALVALSGSLLDPGTNGTGTLSVTNSINLQGSTAMGVGTGSNNLLSGASISYGGTLIVSFVPGSLTAGSSYKLFNSTTATYTGSFASITPSTPGAGLQWDTSQLAVSGKLGIIGSSESPATFSGPYLMSGTNLVLSGSGGTPGAGYRVFSSTNLNTSLTNWTLVTNGTFDGSGNFNITNGLNTNTTPQFFILKEP